MSTTNQETEFKLLAAESFSFKAELAKRTDIPVDLLVQLSTDSMAWIRANVARNPKTPLTVLMTLLNDDEEMVRLSTLRNPALEQSEAYEEEDDGLPAFLRARPKTRKKFNH